MSSPTFVKLDKKLVDVDEDGTLRFLRPLLESRWVSAEPSPQGHYLICAYRQIVFQDPGIVHLHPAVSECQTNTDKKYTQAEAAAEIVRRIAEFKSLGFVKDTVTPVVAPPHGPKPL